MASQLQIVTGNRRPRNQIAELQARRTLLPTIIANRQRAEDIAREAELNRIQQSQFERQHQLAQEQFAFNKSSTIASRKAAERASAISAGLEATKLGTTLATRYGNKTVGSTVNDAKNLFGFKTSGPSPTTSTGGVENFVSNLNLGSAIGGGLAGFGVSKILGKKKNKAVKTLAGSGAGALLGLLGGGNSLGSAISGGFGGALGGLFG